MYELIDESDPRYQHPIVQSGLRTAAIEEQAGEGVHGHPPRPLYVYVIGEGDALMASVSRHPLYGRGDPGVTI